jgi:phage virion morphogenesis protein
MIDKLENLITALSPVRRAMILKKIGRLIRQRNRRRISENVSPDGEDWESRKPQRSSSGRMIARKAKMLKKFSAARNLKMKSGHSGVTVGFYGKMADHGALHQFGGSDEVAKGRDADYPVRTLLGLSDADLNDIYDLVLANLN